MIGLNNYSKNTYYPSNLSNVWFAFVVHPKSNTTQQKETKQTSITNLRENSLSVESLITGKFLK